MVSLKVERDKVRLLATWQGVRELEACWLCDVWAADDLGGFNWGYFLVWRLAVKCLQEGAYPIKSQISAPPPLETLALLAGLHLNKTDFAA